MGVSVGFDYNAWAALFPELSGVSETAANGYFSIAGLYIDNTGRGPIRDANLQQTVLYLATAHIAQLLSQQTNGVSTTGGTEPAPPLVGRITNATEGSVNVTVDFPNQSPNAEFWNMTRYGSLVWVLLKPFRLMRYVRNPRRRIYNPPRYWGGFGLGI